MFVACQQSLCNTLDWLCWPDQLHGVCPAGHYRVPPALGEQKESKRSTSPRAVFGTSTRDDHVLKVGLTKTRAFSTQGYNPTTVAARLAKYVAGMLALFGSEGAMATQWGAAAMCSVTAVPVCPAWRIPVARSPGPSGGQHQGVSTRHQDRHKFEGTGL
jgi:hypothetical protein